MSATHLRWLSGGFHLIPVYYQNDTGESTVFQRFRALLSRSAKISMSSSEMHERAFLRLDRLIGKFSNLANSEVRSAPRR